MTGDKYIEGIRRLRRFESKALVKAQYAKAHDGASISDTKLTSIVMSMRQGRELFESAANTDYTTKPIELYYGIAAYCRAMTLLLNKEVSEDALIQNHGVQFVSLPTRVENAKRLLGIKLGFTDGGFVEWYKKSQDNFWLRVNSSNADWECGYDTDIVSKQISLAELIGLIPDASNELQLLTGKPNPRFMIKSYGDNNVSFDGKASQSQAEACFPGIGKYKITHMNNINWVADTGELSDFVPQFAQLNEDGFEIGSTLIVVPTEGLRLSPLAAYYATAYALSMLARYRPSIWGQIWNGGVADGAYPLLSQVMTTIHKWFPYMLGDNIIKLST